MFGRRPLIRAAVVGSCFVLLLGVSLEWLKQSRPGAVGADIEMTYPKILSGVFVTGFEESSFFPGDTAIPDRNDDRRYRAALIVDPKRITKLREGIPDRGYVAFRVTFLGRRSKHPVSIDCYGGRDYYFIPDWIFGTRYLGRIDDPDIPLPKPGPYKPFKRSGEGGVIRQLEDKALAYCGGAASASTPSH